MCFAGHACERRCVRVCMWMGLGVCRCSGGHVTEVKYTLSWTRALVAALPSYVLILSITHTHTHIDISSHLLPRKTQRRAPLGKHLSSAICLQVKMFEILPALSKSLEQNFSGMPSTLMSSVVPFPFLLCPAFPLSRFSHPLAAPLMQPRGWVC